MVIDRPNSTPEFAEPDRLVLVGRFLGGADFAETLRRRYGDWSVTTCDTYMAGIAEIARQPARAILACVNAGAGQLENAVAGLRDVAGRSARLVLCCTPEGEPLTRHALSSGADDYVIYPPEGDELDWAIGYKCLAPLEGVQRAPAATMEELAELGRILAALGDKPRQLLERIAGLTRMALAARGAMIVMEGAVAMSGETVVKPVLSVPVTAANGAAGQLAVSERVEGSYTPADAEKLSHYARVAGHVLAAASQQRRWHEQSITDECSGLPNRRYFLAKVDEILTRGMSEHFPVTLLLFDVDDFKTYNDRYGHDAGDEILRVTGALFRKNCRKHDIVARYGGDEFAVLFWDPEGQRVAGSKHPESALEVLDRFKEALRSQPFACLGPGGTGRLTISGGLATFPWDGTAREVLLKRADEALLAAKRAGKNRIFLIGQGQPAAQ